MQLHYSSSISWGALLYLCLDPRPRVGGRPPKRACHLLRPAIAARGAQGPCPPRPPVFQPPAGPQRFGERPPLSALGTPRAVQLRRSSPGAAAAAPRHCLSPTALVRVQARDSCPAGGRATRASISAWMVGRCQPVWDVTAGLEGVTRRSAGRSATAGCQTVTLSGCHRHPGDPVQPSNSVLLSATRPPSRPVFHCLACMPKRVELYCRCNCAGAAATARCSAPLPLTRCSCARAGARQLPGRWQGYSGVNVGVDGWSLPACVDRYGRP
jgi:hypothetical protein